jgi:hypothetical protein
MSIVLKVTNIGAAPSKRNQAAAYKLLLLFL